MRTPVAIIFILFLFYLFISLYLFDFILPYITLYSLTFLKLSICIASALLTMLTLIYLIEHYDLKPFLYSSMLVFIVIFKLNSDNPQLILCTLSLLYLTVAFCNYLANDKPKITILQKLNLFLHIIRKGFILFCVKWCFVFIFVL